MDLTAEAYHLFKTAEVEEDALYWYQMWESMMGEVIPTLEAIPDDRHECPGCGWRWGCSFVTVYDVLRRLCVSCKGG